MAGDVADFDDAWEEMPIEHVLGTELEESDASDADVPAAGTSPKRAAQLSRAKAARLLPARTGRVVSHGGTSNHAGEHIAIHDARGYDWRQRPGDDPRSEKPKGNEGYTQLRLDEDEEEEQLHAATEYLFQEDANRFQDGSEDPSVAPISQLTMTKRLLTETQKIAYVGLCSLSAHQLLAETEKWEPADTKPASKSMGEWLLRVMVRLYQHLDIDPTGTCAA